MIYHMCAIRVMVSKELIVVSEYLHPIDITTLIHLGPTKAKGY